MSPWECVLQSHRRLGLGSSGVERILQRWKLGTRHGSNDVRHPEEHGSKCDLQGKRKTRPCWLRFILFGPTNGPTEHTSVCSVCTYVHTYIRTYIQRYLQTYTRTYMRIKKNTHTHTHASLFMYIYIYIICVHIYDSVCFFVERYNTYKTLNLATVHSQNWMNALVNYFLGKPIKFSGSKKGVVPLVETIVYRNCFCA